MAINISIKQLQSAMTVIEKLPAKRILDCCDRITRAEQLAMADDGPVSKTTQVMSTVDLEYCLQILWKCREAAQAKIDAMGG